MRQKLAGAQAVLDMRGGGVVPQQHGSDPNTDSVPAIVGSGDLVIPIRRAQLPEKTFRGLSALPTYPTGAEDTGKMSREYAEQPSYLERNRQQYGILPTMAAWGLGQAVSWGATAALTSAVGAPIPTMGLGPAVMAGTLAAYGKIAGKQPVKMEHGGIVPETMPGEDVSALLQPGEVVVPKQEGLSQEELFRAKMARENAGLPGIGSVPLPPAESVPGSSGAQQKVSLPTTTVQPPQLPALHAIPIQPQGQQQPDQDELFRRKMELENQGIPTAPLAASLAHHQANYQPPQLPNLMAIPIQAQGQQQQQEQAQGSGWEVQRGLTPEEQGILPEQPDASQRKNGQDPFSSIFLQALGLFYGNTRLGRAPSGGSHASGMNSGLLGNAAGTDNGSNNATLTASIDKLIVAVDKLTATMERQTQQQPTTASQQPAAKGQFQFDPNAGAQSNLQLLKQAVANSGNQMIGRHNGSAIAPSGPAMPGGPAQGSGKIPGRPTSSASVPPASPAPKE